MLSSWELIVFTLFKSLTSVSDYAVSSYSDMHYYERELSACTDKKYDRMDEQEKVRRLMTQFKMDKNRMLVILLTRLLKKLIIRTKEAINQQGSIYMQALNQFVMIANECLLEPVIAATSVHRN